MTWDSLLFPDQSTQAAEKGKTRLSVYIGASGGAPNDTEKIARDAVRLQLGVEDEPAEVVTTLWPDSIPQYAVGHYDLMRSADALRTEHFPCCRSQARVTTALARLQTR